MEIKVEIKVEAFVIDDRLTLVFDVGGDRYEIFKDSRPEGWSRGDLSRHDAIVDVEV